MSRITGEVQTISFGIIVKITETGMSDLFIEACVGNDEWFAEMGSFWINGD